MRRPSRTSSTPLRPRHHAHVDDDVGCDSLVHAPIQPIASSSRGVAVKVAMRRKRLYGPLLVVASCYYSVSSAPSCAVVASTEARPSIPLHQTSQQELQHHSPSRRRKGIEERFIPYGFQTAAPPQSTDNHDTYAGGMYYDNTHHLLHMTGSTYSACTLGTLKLPPLPNTGHLTNRQEDRVEGGHNDEPGDRAVRRRDRRRHLDSLPHRHRIGEGVAHHHVRYSRDLSSRDLSVGALNYDFDPANQPTLLYRAMYGKADKMETCSALFPIEREVGKGKLYAIGHSEDGGFLSDLRARGSTKATVYGFVMDLDMTLDVQNGTEGGQVVKSVSMSMNGGELLHETKVQYPVAVTANQLGEVFVATINSDYDDVNPKFNEPIIPIDDGTNEGGEEWINPNPDITAGGGGGIQKYGKDFRFRIVKMIHKTQEDIDAAIPTSEGYKTTMKVDRTEVFAPKEQEEVQLSSLLYVPGDITEEDLLLFAGSTTGFGAAFGSENQTSGWGMDGFVTKMDPTNGFASTDISSPPEPLRLGERSTVRITTGEEGTKETVSGLCIRPNTDGVRDLYVVGSTNGILPGTDASLNNRGTDQNAYLMKLDLDTLQTIWVKQIGAVQAPNTEPDDPDYAPIVDGMGCAVSPDGEVVYLGGTVRNGGKIVKGDGYESNGGDDIFVMEYQTSTGEVNFIRQIGTSKDEMLARGGGIVADRDGNPIVMGTTRGSLMRWRSEEEKEDNNGNRRTAEFTMETVTPVDEKKTKRTLPPADVFVMSLERGTGRHRQPMEKVGVTNGKDVNGTPQNPRIDGITAVPETKDDDKNKAKISTTGILILTALGFLIVSLLSMAIYNLVQNRREEARWSKASQEEDTRTVTEYLSAFDNVDVDLKHSATGGYHGTYEIDFNPVPGGGRDALAATPRNHHHHPPQDVTIALSQRSNLVKESLFLDDDDVPSLGGGDGESDDDGSRSGGSGNSSSGGGSASLGHKKRNSNYGGLVEAYKESWDDRSPHSLTLGGFAMPGSGAAGRKKTDTRTDYAQASDDEVDDRKESSQLVFD